LSTNLFDRAEIKMSSTIHVFSVLAERIGRREIEVDTAMPIPAGELLDILACQYDAVSDLRRVVRLAVNHAYADEDLLVNEGDELALITPTSGG
jgi:molybdopterin converting factor small subunit